MKIITFVYICAFFFGVALLPFNEGNESYITIALCTLLISLVGLPHGAIDHVLFTRTSSKSLKKFYLLYLSLIIAYIVLWIVSSYVAMIMFLLLSAYHFGESQFENLLSKSKLSRALYIVWGIHLLSTYITYQHTALQVMCTEYADMEVFKGLFFTIQFEYLSLIISAVLLVLIFAYLYITDTFSVQRLMQEIYILFLIHISFYLFGPLVSFTLYFVILHSLKVLIDEYDFLNERLSKFSVNSFIKMLIPFTVVSFLGLAILMVVNSNYLQLSLVYLVILSISIITLPHAFVMFIFYNNSKA